MRINPPKTPMSLSQKKADELIVTIKENKLFSQSDQTLLCQIILMFIWLQYTLRETKLSLKKIKKAEPIMPKIPMILMILMIPAMIIHRLKIKLTRNQIIQQRIIAHHQTQMNPIPPQNHPQMML